MVPYYQFQIFADSTVEVCCQSWMRKPIGKLLENTAEEIINSPILAHIQQDMLEGKYSYCNDACPFLPKLILDQPENGGSGGPEKITPANWSPIIPNTKLKEQLKKLNYVVFLNFDFSCNLQCPSCRSELIHDSSKKNPERYKQLDMLQRKAEEMVYLLLKRDNAESVSINMTGSGDPFASEVHWECLLRLNEVIHQPEYAKLQIHLQTNGILMTPERMEKIKNLWPYLGYISVSVDATTQDTYSIVRKGGKLESVLKNLKWLDEKICNKEISVPCSPNGPARQTGWCVNFVVQKQNYKEMADFAKYHLQAKSLNKVWYNLIADWQVLFDNVNYFDTKAIWKDNHPEHLEFLEILRDPVFKDPRVDVGSMISLLRKANNLT